MRTRIPPFVILYFSLALSFGLELSGSQLLRSVSAQTIPLKRAVSPVRNPLKGLVPYSRPHPDRFPHTMEFSYFGLADVMKGYNQFDWGPLEKILKDIASRGNQAVLRTYLEYPDKLNVIPQFLIDDGLKVHKYLNTNTAPFPPAEVETPDYEDPKLRRALKNFITAFGKRYDGDPRIGFLTAGLLGTWGEWHTYPRDELFASKEVQVEVMEAYANAFNTTPILLRYPAGKQTWGKASNAERPFGYHDDSFAWATLDTGKESDSWYYMAALKQAGPAALLKWQTQPIGGEIRPEIWGKVFDINPQLSETERQSLQDFGDCVQATHVSWLMDTGMFREAPTAERLARAKDQVRMMGYDFHVPNVTLTINQQRVINYQIQVTNQGVAPFYMNWKVELAVLIGERTTDQRSVDHHLTKLLPGNDGQRWNGTWQLTSPLPPGATIAMRIANPLPNGSPIRFANQSQDRDRDGWLTIARWSDPQQEFQTP